MNLRKVGRRAKCTAFNSMSTPESVAPLRHWRWPVALQVLRLPLRGLHGIGTAIATRNSNSELAAAPRACLLARQYYAGY